LLLSRGGRLTPFVRDAEAAQDALLAVIGHYPCSLAPQCVPPTILGYCRSARDAVGEGGALSWREDGDGEVPLSAP